MARKIAVKGVQGLADAKRFTDLGVDGIVSDRIDTLAEVLADRGVPLSQ